MKSITINSRGRRVKANNFYTLDAEEIEDNTKWLEENPDLILVREIFLLTDELRSRVERWIKDTNERDEGRT